MCVRAEATGDCASAVHADTERDGEVAARLTRPVYCLQRLFHVEGRPDRTHRIILVISRRSEDGEDLVTDELVDNATVALHAWDERAEIFIEHLHDTSGRQALDERSETADVGKQGRDFAHLAGQREAFAEQFVSHGRRHGSVEDTP